MWLNIENEEHICRFQHQIFNYLIRNVRYADFIDAIINCATFVSPKPYNILAYPSVLWICDFKANIHGVSGMGLPILGEEMSILDQVVFDYRGNKKSSSTFIAG